MPSDQRGDWHVFCDSCFLDEHFPTQEHANKMKVYHDATFDCSDEANKEVDDA